MLGAAHTLGWKRPGRMKAAESTGRGCVSPGLRVPTRADAPRNMVGRRVVRRLPNALLDALRERRMLSAHLLQLWLLHTGGRGGPCARAQRELRRRMASHCVCGHGNARGWGGGRGGGGTCSLTSLRVSRASLIVAESATCAS